MPYDFYDNSDEQGNPAGDQQRPYIGMMFDCCNVYVRLYRQPDQQYYLGRCPKCLRTIRLRVGPNGVPDRFFRAT